MEVDERGERVISDDSCLRDNGKQRRRGVAAEVCAAPGLGYEQSHRQHCLHFGFSQYLIATMQPVVIGQAPLSLERKISSGGKQILTEHNATTETDRIPQTRKKKGESV